MFWNQKKHESIEKSEFVAFWIQRKLKNSVITKFIVFWEQKRVENMNTSKAEQIFSWFRSYASTFNSMDALRHKFMVLFYCKQHNSLVEEGITSRLNVHSANRKKMARVRKGSGYACGKGVKKVKK